MIRIQKGVKAAEPFFAWLAERAVQESRLNVVNCSRSLFDRYGYFLEQYRAKAAEAKARADERIVETREIPSGTVTQITIPAWELTQHAHWLALAVIEAFFSWTEHVFIHLAVLTGKITTAADVAELAAAEWQVKFKKALDLKDSKTKSLFDELVVIRRQLRNFVAHGAFGKQGEAFRFHSGAGAVPVLLPQNKGDRQFSLGSGLEFDDAGAVATIEEFVSHLWLGEREPMRLHVQHAELPTILTYAADGTYSRVVQSVAEMEEFVDALSHRLTNAANMDW